MYEVRCIDGTVAVQDLTVQLLLAKAESDPKHANLYIANVERHLHFKWGMGYYVARVR